MIHATVIGNLGSDAELKVLQSGKVVANFSIAARGRDRNAEATWVRAAMWGARAEKVVQYLTKGSRVAVSGTMSTREHNGKTYLELDVQELELLGDKRTESSSSSRGPARAPSRGVPDPDPYNGDDLPF